MFRYADGSASGQALEVKGNQAHVSGTVMQTSDPTGEYVHFLRQRGAAALPFTPILRANIQVRQPQASHYVTVMASGGENEAVLNRVLDIVNRRAWDELPDVYSDDYVSIDERRLALWEATRGLAEARQFFESTAAGVKTGWVGSEVLAVREDALAAETTATGTTDEYGLSFEVIWTEVVRFRGGKIVERRVFDDRERALQALDEIGA